MRNLSHHFRLAASVERYSARLSWRVGLSVVISILAMTGCQSWINRKKEEPFEKDARRAKEMLSDPDRPRLVGEIGSTLGLAARQYDTFGLITMLHETGGIVKPSPQRQFMMDDMRRRDVNNPEQILDSPYTAMASVRVYANPCEEKNDIVDVTIIGSDECTATDFRDGFLMPATLREYVVLGGRNRSSNDKATATGDLVIYPASYMRDSTLNPLAGVVIGGGKLLETPKLAIRIDQEYRHVLVVRAIEKAINKRFFFTDSSKQQLVATGKNDWQIAIETVPKYRWDPQHYFSTIMSTGFNETESQVQERIEGCKKLLLDRETARRAACELEAIGTPAAREVLLEGLASNQVEVRFQSAYSLAYLDRPEAVPVLSAIARTERAFRPLCLIGLGVDEHSSARDALVDLLQEPEPELRFGALWAIRQKNPRDPVVQGENIREICSLVQIPSQTPLVAVSLEQMKEVVIFGNNPSIQLDKPITPTPSFKLSPAPSNSVRLTKRQYSGETVEMVVSSDLASVLRAMPAVSSNYNDIVHLIDQLGLTSRLASPTAMNPRPKAGRVYQRDTDTPQCDEPMETVKVDGSSRAMRSKKSWMSLSSFLTKPKPERSKLEVESNAADSSASELD